jgi:hypothetical protein
MIVARQICMTLCTAIYVCCSTLCLVRDLCADSNSPIIQRYYGFSALHLTCVMHVLWSAVALPLPCPLRTVLCDLVLVECQDLTEGEDK